MLLETVDKLVRGLRVIHTVFPYPYGSVVSWDELGKVCWVLWDGGDGSLVPLSYLMHKPPERYIPKNHVEETMNAEPNALRGTLFATVRNFFAGSLNAPSPSALGFLVDDVLKVVDDARKAPPRKLMYAVEIDEGNENLVALLDIPESLVGPLEQRLSDLDAAVNLRDPGIRLIHCDTLEEALTALGKPATLRDVLIRQARRTVLSLGSPPEAEIQRLAERGADDQIALFRAHGWTGPDK